MALAVKTIKLLQSISAGDYANYVSEVDYDSQREVAGYLFDMTLEQIEQLIKSLDVGVIRKPKLVAQVRALTSDSWIDPVDEPERRLKLFDQTLRKLYSAYFDDLLKRAGGRQASDEVAGGPLTADEIDQADELSEGSEELKLYDVFQESKSEFFLAAGSMVGSIGKPPKNTLNNINDNLEGLTDSYAEPIVRVSSTEQAKLASHMLHRAVAEMTEFIKSFDTEADPHTMEFDKAERIVKNIFNHTEDPVQLANILKRELASTYVVRLKKLLTYTKETGS